MQNVIIHQGGGGVGGGGDRRLFTYNQLNKMSVVVDLEFFEFRIFFYFQTFLLLHPKIRYENAIFHNISHSFKKKGGRNFFHVPQGPPVNK